MTTFINCKKPQIGEEIIIPYLAIDNNIDFIMLHGGIGQIELSDGTICESVECIPIKFSQSDKEINRIYKMSKERWRMMWLKRVPAISDEIVKLKLHFINE